MITLSESSLTTEEWTALQSLVSGASFEVTLYAWNPVFDTPISGSVSRNDFDSAVYSGTIWRLSGDGLYDLSDNSLGSYTDPDGADWSKVPSLFSSDGLYAVVITSTGISRAAYDGSWSAWEEIVTDDSIVFVAATSSTTVHYVTLSSDNYQFHVWEDGDITDSSVYWGFPMTSFSARRISGKDVLAFTANTPGTPSSKTENLKVVKYILPTGILGIITYQYGTWSDHIEVDRVDQWSNFRYRSNVKLSVIDSKLWMTCYSSEGRAKQPVVGTRFYCSKDGIHWTRGELVSLAVSGVWGTSLQRLGDTIYALGRIGGSSADSTLWFDYPTTSTTMDLSPYIHQLTVSRRDMQQISIVVDNSRGWISDTLLGQKRTMTLLLKTGFWIPVTGYVTQRQGLFEVDNVEPSMDQPDRMVQISGRDRLAWMTTKTQSEQFVNWLPQGLGLDAYIDTTETGYGGMTHSAPADGTWQAHDNLLYLTTSNQSGLVYSTYLFDTWNGSVQSHFGLSSASNGEYAGLIFRSQDKDNGYAYYYDQATDKLRLERWSGGDRTLVWQSSTKSWGGVASRYLRVDFYYSEIRMYSSSASPAVNARVTWTLENTSIVSGFSSSAVSDSGYVGMMGRGFSDLEYWNEAPDPIGPGDLPPWYDPYDPATPSNLPPYTGDVLPISLIVFDWGASHCHVSTQLNLTTGDPVYIDASSGLSGYSLDARADPWNYSRYFSINAPISAAGDGLYRNDNPFGGSSWSLVASFATIGGGGAFTPRQMEMSINRRGYIAIMADECFAYSFDYGVTWGQSTIGSGTGHFAISPFNNGSEGWIYAAQNHPAVYKSEDWGQTWSYLSSTDGGTANISVPYMKPGGTEANVNNSSQVILYSWVSGDYQALMISHNAGATWSYSIYQYQHALPVPWANIYGRGLVPFTWDADYIAMQARGTNFLLLHHIPTVQTDDMTPVSYYSLTSGGDQFPGADANYIRVESFSNNRYAHLQYHPSFPWFTYGFTPDNIYYVGNAPAGYSGIGVMEFSLRDFQ